MVSDPASRCASRRVSLSPRERVTRPARGQAPSPLFFAARGTPSSRSRLPGGSGAPGNAGACEAPQAVGETARHACEACPLRLRGGEAPLGAPLAAISVPGSALPGTRHLPVPVQPSSRRRGHSAPRSGPEASRVPAYEAGPRAPHPAPSSRRLATTPSNKQNAHMINAPKRARISFFRALFLRGFSRRSGDKSLRRSLRLILRRTPGACG